MNYLICTGFYGPSPNTHCVSSILDEGKMHPRQFGFYDSQNWCKMPNSTKKFTLHNVLLSYQPIGTADPAQVGQIGHADWLVVQKDIVENDFF